MVKSDSTKKISVVIPVFNEAEILDSCLAAIRRQTLKPYELIVVDNNSSDDSVEIAARYGATIIHEYKQGITPTVYAGFNAATGDIIARCDADSIVPVDWLETIHRRLEQNPNAAGITGPGKFYGSTRFVNAFAQVWYMNAYFALVGSALANWPLFGSNCAIRRTAWHDVRNEMHKDRTDIHEDIDISMHLPPSSRIIYERNMTVGISARALKARQLPLRFARGFRSLAIHWPQQSPARRWRQRVLEK